MRKFHQYAVVVFGLILIALSILMPLFASILNPDLGIGAIAYMLIGFWVVGVGVVFTIVGAIHAVLFRKYPTKCYKAAIIALLVSLLWFLIFKQIMTSGL